MSGWTGEPLSNQVYRIRQLRNGIRTKLINLGILENTSQYEQEQVVDRSGESAGATLDECATAIEGMGGSLTISNKARTYVAGKETAQVVDNSLIASNIRRGKTILGVPGTYSGTTYQLPTKPYTWYYGEPGKPTTIYPSADSSGFEEVRTVLTSSDTSTLIPENIAKGVTIMGVEGTYGINSMLAGHNTNYNTSGTQTGKKITFDIGWYEGAYDEIVDEPDLIPYNQISTNAIQLGCGVCYYANHYYHNGEFYVDIRGEWNPPDRSKYYVFRITFGRNKYENGAKFLSVDVMKRSLLSSDEIYHLRVKGNDPGYSIVQAPNGKARLEIDLTGKSFAYADGHETIGNDFDYSSDVEFDRSGTTDYHIDVRW